MNPGHKRLACVLAVAGSLDCQAAITEDREEIRLVPTSIVRSVSVRAAERVVAFNPDVSLPNDPRRTTTGDDWPNIHVEDAYTRDAATRALATTT